MKKLSFPEWRGRSVAIVASGPSTQKQDVKLLDGTIATIAIKENHEICPWAEVVYGCDRAWWRNEQGLPKYHGIKITGSDVALDWPSIHRVKIDAPNDRLLPVESGMIGSGGNSGFQALNLAIQFGAKRILLIGYDMSDQHGQHWYGPNKGEGRTNPGWWNFGRWRKAFDGTQHTLASLGVEVVNASPLSALNCYKKATIAETLERWGLTCCTLVSGMACVAA